MNFRVSQQYAHGEEKLLAGFSDAGEARIFMTQKSNIAEEEHKRVIYRMYDDDELVQEVNKENICVTHASYAENGIDYDDSGLVYHLMMKSMDSTDKQEFARFADKDDARQHVIWTLESGGESIKSAVFLLFKDNMLIDTLNLNTIRHQQQRAQISDGSASTRHLSPLPTRPTPGGGPPDYWVDDKEDK
ncbi:hypothetical protein [Legionella sp. CNM-4043-24]|uniref:hypothetical protein n=1 Tax=Legionella sp. CNM-4043-24 TaxID=3421646 RepID=UPI00403B32C0